MYIISGMCKLFGNEMHPSLMRPTRTPEAQAQVQDLFSEISDWEEIELMLDEIEAELQRLNAMDNSESDVEILDADSDVEMVDAANNEPPIDNN